MANLVNKILFSSKFKAFFTTILMPKVFIKVDYTPESAHILAKYWPNVYFSVPLHIYRNWAKVFVHENFCWDQNCWPNTLNWHRLLTDITITTPRISCLCCKIVIIYNVIKSMRDISNKKLCYHFTALK